MFGGICWNPSPSILSISSNRRNHRSPKAFSVRASSSANHLPLASKVLVRRVMEKKIPSFMCASGLVKSLHSECLGGYCYAVLNTTAQACTCDCITDGLFSIAGYCTNMHKHNESNIDLSYSTDETSLRKQFSSFGQVIEVKLFKDESTERSRGFAFVQYTCQDDAMLAIENLDRKRMDGRVVYVELAKPMNFRFAAYPRTSGPPTGQHSKNEICSEGSSNGEMP